MNSLLEIANLSKRFGGICATANCNLRVAESSAHGIIGPNGAGKTTLFNLITGIYQPTEGTIRFRDQSIAGLRPNHIASLGIGRTFQNIRLCKSLTVLDNVRIAFDSQLDYSPLHALFRLPRSKQQEALSIEQSMLLLQPFGLAPHADQPAGSLPYGSQRKLEIARALALRPKLLLLDEPAAGMNSGETSELTDFLTQIRTEFKVTLLLIEHHIELVMKLCDRITVLDFGQSIADDTPEGIRANPRVIEAYLGVPEDDQ